MIKTGQEIHDYIEKHPDYECAKKCLWVKMEDSSLANFIEAMIEKIRQKEGMYGQAFPMTNNFNLQELRNHLKREISEWFYAQETSGEKGELIDLVNLGYFIWRRL